MRKLHIYIIILYIPFLGYSQQKESKEVLFVGNSFTYFWNVPQMVEAMAKHAKVPLITEQSTVGGSNLKQHWKSEKGITTRVRLENQQWDYVILQDHSMSTINAEERWKTYNKKFIHHAREKGVQPVLFSSWAYKSNPLMQRKISESYRSLSVDQKTPLIPMGSILKLAREKRPDLDFFFDDKHLSPIGSYLEALVIYRFLTSQPVSKIPDRLTTEDANGEKLYLMFILPKTGKFLRQLVEDYPIKSLKAKK